MKQATESKRHQGWANYETWAVKLWIDNEQAEQDYWLESARGYEGDAYNLAGYLKDQYQEHMPELEGVYADLLNASLGEVDWLEIAEALIEDANDKS